MIDAFKALDIAVNRYRELNTAVLEAARNGEFSCAVEVDDETKCKDYQTFLISRGYTVMTSVSSGLNSNGSISKIFVLGISWLRPQSSYVEE